MKDYCTCGIRRIDQTFLSRGFVFCVDCRQPLCCDVVLSHPTVEPHAAEVGDGHHFECWRHWDSVANLSVSHAVAAK